MRKAYSIDELVKGGPFSRSHLYDEIKAGRLVVRKSGTRTVVLDTDWAAFLEALPKADAGESKAA